MNRNIIIGNFDSIAIGDEEIAYIYGRATGPAWRTALESICNVHTFLESEPSRGVEKEEGKDEGGEEEEEEKEKEWEVESLRMEEERVKASLRPTAGCAITATSNI